MMQKLLVILLVVIAICYLGWKAYKRYAVKKSKCDKCGFD